MTTGNGLSGGWGISLGLVLGVVAVGCAPRTEIGGEDDDAGGSSGSASTGDGRNDSTGDSGNGSAGTGRGGYAGTPGGTGGAGGTRAQPGGGSAGTGMFEPADGDGCFDRMTAAGSPIPELGPDNAVFPAGRQNTDQLLNYADQVVFDPPNWELNANFPPSDRSDDISIMLPEELADIAQNVGEIHITRRNCEGESAAGRTVKVHAWWKLRGAIGRTPTEGIALGTTDGTTFSDATRASLVGSSGDSRPLNTLNPIVLEHTFAATDDVDAGNLVLRLWLIETFDFPSTLYINRIEWE